MRADADADVKVAFDRKADRSAGRVQIGAAAGEVEIEKIAALFEAHALRGKIVGLDVFGVRAFFFAILQRGEAVAVQRGVDVDGICVERLANHQHAFAMRVAADSVEINVGADADVARHFFPGELEIVFGHPHVVAAAGDCVGLRGGVVFGRAGMEDFADVVVGFKDADGAAFCSGVHARPGVCACNCWQQRAAGENRQRRKTTITAPSLTLIRSPIFSDSAPSCRRQCDYGITLIITTPCDGTVASYLPVILPRSLCAQRSRTLAVRCAG